MSDRLMDEGHGTPSRAGIPDGRGASKGERRNVTTGGGPRSRTGKERALANLDPKRGGGGWRHGLYAWMGSGGAMAPPCSRCAFSARCERYEHGATCAVAREYQEQVEAEIMGLKHIKPEDRFVVADFAVTATGLRIADEYIAAQGPFTVDEEGEVAVREAILDLRHRLSASLMRQADALGLTPQARARLKLADGQGGRGGLASLLLEAEQIQAARRAAEEEATVEGDFELQVEGTAGDG